MNLVKNLIKEAENTNSEFVEFTSAEDIAEAQRLVSLGVMEEVEGASYDGRVYKILVKIEDYI